MITSLPWSARKNRFDLVYRFQNVIYEFCFYLFFRFQDLQFQIKFKICNFKLNLVKN